MPNTMQHSVSTNLQMTTGGQGSAQMDAQMGAPSASAQDAAVIRIAAQEEMMGPGMYGSMQEALADNLGLYAVCEFVVGTQSMETKEGILYSVGRSFVVLYDERQQTFVLCDVFSIKFATLYLPGHRPWNVTRTPTVPMVEIPGVGTVPSGPYGIGTGSTPHLQSGNQTPSAMWGNPPQMR